MLYLILANFYVAVFFAFYWVALRKQTFFRWNRIYLLGGLALAFVLPVLDISAWYTYSTAYPQYLIGTGETVVVQGGTVEVSPATSFDWKRLLTWLYATGCVVSFLYFLLRITQTFRQLRTSNSGSAFSFFKTIRVDSNLKEHEQMEAHEHVHAKEWHSADLIIMQFVKVFNWFNPVIYYYERALRMQHEYLADDLTAEGDKLAYAELLVARAMRTERTALVHTFSSNRGLKSRVAMLLKDKSPKENAVRFALLAPLVVAMVIFSIACNQQRAGSSERSALSTDVAADTVGGWVNTSENISFFTEEIGKHVRYEPAALRDGKEGVLAFTFEKAKNGHIEQIKFLNELWDGQQEQVLSVLQTKRVDSLAPAGKYLGSIEFRIQGKERSADEMPPPPPPVPVDYIPLSSVVIIGHSPDHTVGTEPNVTKEVVQKTAVRKAAKTPPKESLPENQIFQAVEVAPEPPGGMKRFMQYVAQTYDFPQEAIDAGINGQVLISFIVEKDGSLTDKKVIEDLGYGTGKEAMRVLQLAQNWLPGIQNGHPVRVAYTLPIRLNLQQ